jgi:pimeloyl-ACP methyl ester carboxylesterase
VNRPIVLAGASLGGAAAIEFASRYPEAVTRLVLIDAQGFIDGIGPMGMLPTPIAKAGVDILRTRWLRSGANKMAYFDQKYATDDAQNVGRLHTLLPQWNDATLSFMRSGGFRVVEKIPQLTTKTMVLWGRGDKILEPENAERFEKEIQDCELVWVEESGHVPHLEQPDFTCAQLLRFGKK